MIFCASLFLWQLVTSHNLLACRKDQILYVILSAWIFLRRQSVEWVSNVYMSIGCGADTTPWSMCVHVCVCVSVFVCRWVRVCVPVCVCCISASMKAGQVRLGHTCVPLPCVRPCVYMSMCFCFCLCFCVSACVFVCLCVCACISACVCLCVCVYICKHEGWPSQTRPHRFLRARLAKRGTAAASRILI